MEILTGTELRELASQKMQIAFEQHDKFVRRVSVTFVFREKIIGLCLLSVIVIVSYRLCALVTKQDQKPAPLTGLFQHTHIIHLLLSLLYYTDYIGLFILNSVRSNPDRHFNTTHCERIRNHGMKESPYFRKRRQQSSGESGSPYFRKAPSSPFGAVQSMGSLLSCLGRSVEPHSNQLHLCSVDSCADLARNAICHFEDCAVFRKSWETSTCHHHKDEAKRLERSVRHLCRHRCYFRAYAPARAWLALRETLQSETCLPIKKLLQGWSCILVPSSCGKDTPRVAFVDPLNQVVWNEEDVLQRIVGARRERKRVDSKRSHRIPKCSLAGRESTDGCILFVPTKRRNLFSTSPKRISITESPLGLLEELFVDDPFQLLLSTIFLNRTTRIQVDHILCEFLEQWSTPESLLGAELNHLVTVLRPMGMCHRRAAGIQQFTRDYLEKARQTDPRNFSGKDLLGMFYCGRYSMDAYMLFIQRNGSVEPLDHALRAYVCYQRGLL